MPTNFKDMPLDIWSIVVRGWIDNEKDWGRLEIALGRNSFMNKLHNVLRGIRMPVLSVQVDPETNLDKLSTMMKWLNDRDVSFRRLEVIGPSLRLVLPALISSSLHSVEDFFIHSRAFDRKSGKLIVENISAETELLSHMPQLKCYASRSAPLGRIISFLPNQHLVTLTAHLTTETSVSCFLTTCFPCLRSLSLFCFYSIDRRLVSYLEANVPFLRCLSYEVDEISYSQTTAQAMMWSQRDFKESPVLFQLEKLALKTQSDHMACLILSQPQYTLRDIYLSGNSLTLTTLRLLAVQYPSILYIVVARELPSIEENTDGFEEDSYGLPADSHKEFCARGHFYDHVQDLTICGDLDDCSLDPWLTYRFRDVPLKRLEIKEFSVSNGIETRALLKLQLKNLLELRIRLYIIAIDEWITFLSLSHLRILDVESSTSPSFIFNFVESVRHIQNGDIFWPDTHPLQVLSLHFHDYAMVELFSNIDSVHMVTNQVLKFLCHRYPLIGSLSLKGDVFSVEATSLSLVILKKWRKLHTMLSESLILKPDYHGDYPLTEQEKNDLGPVASTSFRKLSCKALNISSIRSILSHFRQHFPKLRVHIQVSKNGETGSVSRMKRTLQDIVQEFGSMCEITFQQELIRCIIDKDSTSEPENYETRVESTCLLL